MSLKKKKKKKKNGMKFVEERESLGEDDEF